MLYDFVFKIFPLVNKELDFWYNYVKTIPDKELSRQGIDSIETKKFHAIGGSVFSLYNPEYINILTSLIVAYQTISDYLDNLCDRMGINSQQAFEKLHDSLFDALLCSDSKSFKGEDYYSFFSRKDDGKYLNELVSVCQANTAKLPGYYYVKKEIAHFIKLYRDLQVLKHMGTQEREYKLKNWFTRYKEFYPPVKWWEFSCASGSTLVIFALLALSTKSDFYPQEKDNIVSAYFPWIAGLHIMLDYYIDQAEDEIEGDMNLVSYYEDKHEQEKGMLYFYEKSIEKAPSLTNKEFHLTVVKGMLALYLSDPKVKAQRLQGTAKRLLKKGGRDAILMYYICLVLRMKRAF